MIELTINRISFKNFQNYDIWINKKKIRIYNIDIIKKNNKIFCEESLFI